MPLQTESGVMRKLRSLGLDRWAWALRRYHCPVASDALVLEVGSGGNPYGRSNVLLDAYENTGERHWVPLTSDRPTVLGFVENLPFRDNAFDFIIAAHVLEHSTDPERFLSELQRVGRAGYIEVPDAMMERLNPYRDHRLEITSREGTLIIRKKRGWQHDPDVVELYEHAVKGIVTKETIPNHPFEFHVRYYWQDKIHFNLLNPETDSSWVPPPSQPTTEVSDGLRPRMRTVLRALGSQRKRNAQLDLLPLLRCTTCQNERLERDMKCLYCPSCHSLFPIRKGVVVMNEPTLN